jgi:hypothetical protein
MRYLHFDNNPWIYITDLKKLDLNRNLRMNDGFPVGRTEAVDLVREVRFWHLAEGI